MARCIAQTGHLQPSALTALLHLCPWLVCSPTHILSFTAVPGPAPFTSLSSHGWHWGWPLTAIPLRPRAVHAEDSKDLSVGQHQQVSLHERQGCLALVGSPHGLCNRQFVTLA